MSGWPNPNKPGEPLNPNVDGRHWLFDPEHNNFYPLMWIAEISAWASGDAWSPKMIVDAGIEYRGPVLTPAEADALRAENAHLKTLMEQAADEIESLVNYIYCGDPENQFAAEAYNRDMALPNAIRKALGQEVKP
jgi:hypothetical protein